MHLLTQESPCWLEEGLFFLYAAEASEAKENRVQHSNPRILYTRENVQKQARHLVLVSQRIVQIVRYSNMSLLCREKEML